MYIGTSRGEEGAGVRRKRVAREQKKDTEQVYDKNAFATIDIGEKHYHMYCTVLKNTEKMSSLDVFTQSPNTLFLI